ncbi:hypothetical protein ACGFY6_27070 [Streptomyces sp. NPDC048387]|uniref:hypothetical protein n=1 Tax=Streptomyces sp. NPDC048387 TaxID=3365542 RepID=UPI00370F8AD0
MSRTPRSLRLVLLTASASLAAGGVLLPTGAFAAAPATPHLAASPAHGHGHRHHGSEEGDGSGSGGQDAPPPADPGGVVPPDRCDDPTTAPGLCVDGKPLPKGDGHVVVPQGPPVIQSPTGSGTTELAV